MKRRTFLQLASAAAVSPAFKSNAPFRMLVLGDSVTWGQGLLESQKMHILVRDMLRGDGLMVDEPLFEAHSGAVIGIDRFAVVDTDAPTDFIDREIPNPRPSIILQCDSVYKVDPNARFDLLLVCGGINDVSIYTIFDPFTTPAEIVASTHLHCYNHMAALLDRLQAQFVQPYSAAQVFVLGYYPILGESSKITDVAALFRAFGIFPPIQVALNPKAYRDRNTGSFPNNVLLQNSRAFFSESQSALQLAVNDARERLSPSFHFVPSAIQEQNAAYTVSPLIFDLDENGLPKDPRYVERRDRFCAVRTGVSEFICDRASVGHPNAAGAAVYAKQIYKLLQSNALERA